tara:strand:+ start:373 stop:825 length:453 start_codon:yes stop_codon:yes gene_type:complete
MIKKITDKSFWRRVGENARDRYKDMIFEKGKTAYGTKYLNGKYSADYRVAKASGKIKRSAAAYANKVVPVLTTDLQNDLDKFLKPLHDGVQFGYTKQGFKVKSLRDRFGKKGTLTSKDQPLPDKVVKYILKEYNNYIKKNSKNKTRHHRK